MTGYGRIPFCAAQGQDMTGYGRIPFCAAQVQDMTGYGRIPFCAAQNPRSAQIPLPSRRKPAVSQSLATF